MPIEQSRVFTRSQIARRELRSAVSFYLEEFSKVSGVDQNNECLVSIPFGTGTKQKIPANLRRFIAKEFRGRELSIDSIEVRRAPSDGGFLECYRISILVKPIESLKIEKAHGLTDIIVVPHSEFLQRTEVDVFPLNNPMKFQLYRGRIDNELIRVRGRVYPHCDMVKKYVFRPGLLYSIAGIFWQQGEWLRKTY